MDKAVKYFRWVVWLGILLDWLWAIPAIFYPSQTLQLIGHAPSGNDYAWVAFAALLTVLVTLFYIPSANDPRYYRPATWLTVLARLSYALFFLLLYPRNFYLVGIVNAVFFVVEALLWRRILKSSPQPYETQRPATAEPQSWEPPYTGSTFAWVKQVTFEGEYERLPYHRGLGLASALQFVNGSARNLIEVRDIRPRFDKLIHANGICFSGVWHIDQDSPYTGYFSKGSQGLVIARFSVAGNQLMRGSRRALGIAGKVFPTMDRDLKVKPGNFVTVSRLSGLRGRHVVDQEVTNKPEIGLDPAANFINRVIFRLMDTRPGYRLLHPISSLGVLPGNPIVTPDLMMLKVADSTPRVDEADFRDELRLRNYPGNRLVYTINVKSFNADCWTPLGKIEFTEDSVSEGGDKRLHFWIPQDFPVRN